MAMFIECKSLYSPGYKNEINFKYSYCNKNHNYMYSQNNKIRLGYVGKVGVGLQ